MRCGSEVKVSEGRKSLDDFSELPGRRYTIKGQIKCGDRCVRGPEWHIEKLEIDPFCAWDANAKPFNGRNLLNSI
jgi:hypothetical protein